MDVEKMNRKELTDKELVKVTGGEGGGMDIGEAPPVSGVSSLGLPDMVAEREKRELADTNPFSSLTNVDTHNRPPTPPSPVAESVKKAVDAALQNW